MSTRCQVLVRGVREVWGGENELESHLLYHHSDGYPEGSNGMVRLIEAAYFDVLGDGYRDWVLGRPGKVAAIIAGCDNYPGAFDLEAYDKDGAHGDIEFFYFVEVQPNGDWILITYEVCGNGINLDKVGAKRVTGLRKMKKYSKLLTKNVPKPVCT
jgi:hypothetical protein